MNHHNAIDRFASRGLRAQAAVDEIISHGQAKGANTSPAAGSHHAGASQGAGGPSQGRSRSSRKPKEEVPGFVGRWLIERNFRGRKTWATRRYGWTNNAQRAWHFMDEESARAEIRVAGCKAVEMFFWKGI